MLCQMHYIKSNWYHKSNVNRMLRCIFYRRVLFRLSNTKHVLYYMANKEDTLLWSDRNSSHWLNELVLKDYIYSVYILFYKKMLLTSNIVSCVNSLLFTVGLWCKRLATGNFFIGQCGINKITKEDTKKVHQVKKKSLTGIFTLLFLQRKKNHWEPEKFYFEIVKPTRKTE